MKLCVYCSQEVNGYACTTCNEYDGVVDTDDLTYEEKVELGIVKLYRVKMFGKYVMEKDQRYLVECEKKDSVFSEDTALDMKKKNPKGITLELIE